MKKPPPDAPVHTKTLVEQKTDFTAEGSPPPGKVVGSVPPATLDATPVVDGKPPHPTSTSTESRAATRASPPQRKGPARMGKYY